MSNVPTVISATALPAIFRTQEVVAANAELTAGVTAGFPVISYRGKVWRIRKGGKETSWLDSNGDPVPSVELVLLHSNPALSKIFYEKAFEEGSTEAPRCWSADGSKPDPTVIDPINPVCSSCPNNAWGSKITPSGAKTRACSDTRRMAVAFANDLEANGKDAHLFLMRVPAASLNPLKEFTDKMLSPKGIPYFAVVMRIGFDPAVAYPKLTFKFSRMVTDDEAEAIVTLRDSDEVARILSEATEEISGGDTAPARAASAAPTPATPAAVHKAKPKPVEEEDVEVEEEPVAVNLPPIPTDDEPEPEPVVTPVFHKPKAKKKVAAAPADEPVVAKPVASAPPGNKAQFNDMLKSILGK
jgi:hypothetical protein